MSIQLKQVYELPQALDRKRVLTDRVTKKLKH